MEKGAIDLTVTLDLERYKAWRRVVVPGDATFVQLHKIIQCVFSWQDRHPYQFDINGISIVDPHLPNKDQTTKQVTFNFGWMSPVFVRLGGQKSLVFIVAQL